MVISQSGFRLHGLELQHRLESDPNLSNISVLSFDQGMMPTQITAGTLNCLIRSIFFIVAHIVSRISPNGMIRLPHKSATGILEAAVTIGPPFGERPKGLYSSGSEPKNVSTEAEDAEKRAAV
ncbi:putative short-chain dehydrogenase [Seiridium cupressi]